MQFDVRTFAANLPGDSNQAAIDFSADADAENQAVAVAIAPGEHPEADVFGDFDVPVGNDNASIEDPKPEDVSGQSEAPHNS